MNKIKEIKKMSPEVYKNKLSRIKKIFHNIPILKGYGGYPYSAFSLTDFNPPMNAQLVEDMADLIVYDGNFENVNLIVSEADRGAGPLTQAVALRTGIPYTLANWYPIQSWGSIKVATKVGFSGRGVICVYGVKKGDSIIIVDDLISSGGTAKALIESVYKVGASVTETIFVANKHNMGGEEMIKDKFKIPVKYLLKFEALGEKTRVL